MAGLTGLKAGDRVLGCLPDKAGQIAVIESFVSYLPLPSDRAAKIPPADQIGVQARLLKKDGTPGKTLVGCRASEVRAAS